MEYSDRVRELVSGGRVKRHTFAPGGRVVWTVVGRTGEHWVDPDNGYCSCMAFYFGGHEGRPCYHLDAVLLAMRLNEFEDVGFADGEFPDFIRGLVLDL